MNVPELDIVIPVYNEGENILSALQSLYAHVRTSFRVFICYDFEADNTLPVVKDFMEKASHGKEILIEFVKNSGKGAHGAIMSGFNNSDAAAVLVLPADDETNATQIDLMMEKYRSGCDIVAACRFMPGGSMQGCPWLKDFLVRSAAFSLYYFARVPSRDPTNGLRLFSRKTLKTIPIKSTHGFAYSIELLVKAHRAGLKVADVPSRWIERKRGKSRFRVGPWLLIYLKWYTYAFCTTFLRLRS
jgi:glycosyltransferase involved in cell wall biosynthesis